MAKPGLTFITVIGRHLRSLGLSYKIDMKNNIFFVWRQDAGLYYPSDFNVKIGADSVTLFQNRPVKAGRIDINKGDPELLAQITAWFSVPERYFLKPPFCDAYRTQDDINVAAARRLQLYAGQ